MKCVYACIYTPPPLFAKCSFQRILIFESVIIDNCQNESTESKMVYYRVGITRYFRGNTLRTVKL